MLTSKVVQVFCPICLHLTNNQFSTDYKTQQLIVECALVSINTLLTTVLIRDI